MLVRMDLTTSELVTAAMQTAERSKRWTAEKAGIALTTFHRKLRGGADFTVPELSRIAKALGVRPSSLLPEEFRDSAPVAQVA